MKLLIKTGASRQPWIWAQRVLFAVALLLLGYCGFVALDTWVFQARESAELERFAPNKARGRVVPADTPIGKIEVERLGLSVVVMEGTSDKTLRRAVGHIAGTGFPGQPGNMGIAGHRDTFFRPLRKIQPGDIIALTTPRGAYRYRVVSTEIVDPDDVAVLNSDGNEILTLVTCYPFYYLGSAPERFIVRAARVS